MSRPPHSPRLGHAILNRRVESNPSTPVRDSTAHLRRRDVDYPTLHLLVRFRFWDKYQDPILIERKMLQINTQKLGTAKDSANPSRIIALSLTQKALRACRGIDEQLDVFSCQRQFLRLLGPQLSFYSSPSIANLRMGRIDGDTLLIILKRSV